MRGRPDWQLFIWAEFVLQAKRPTFFFCRFPLENSSFKSIRLEFHISLQ